MLHQTHGILLAIDVNVIIYVVAHLSHFARERKASRLHHQLGAIDVERLILPGTLTIIKGALEGTQERFLRGHDGVLTSLIDVDNRSPRFQDAKMVALHRE